MKLNKKVVIDKAALIAQQIIDLRNTLHMADKAKVGELEAYSMGFLMADALRCINQVQHLVSQVPE